MITIGMDEYFDRLFELAEQRQIILHITKFNYYHGITAGIMQKFLDFMEQVADNIGKLFIEGQQSGETETWGQMSIVAQ